MLRINSNIEPLQRGDSFSNAWYRCNPYHRKNNRLAEQLEQLELEKEREPSEELSLQSMAWAPRSVFKLNSKVEESARLNNPSEHLPTKLQDRIDQTENGEKLDGSEFTIGSGSGVHVILLDTGVMTNHQEFGSRANFDSDTFASRRPNLSIKRGDPDGHGTKVASVIMGTNVGVARGATLHSIRVAGLEGDNTSPSAQAYRIDVRLALNTVTCWEVRQPLAKCVVLYNVAKRGDKKIDQMFRDFIRRTNCVVVVPAGNTDDASKRDSCDNSPARVDGLIRVGASDINQDTKDDTLHSHSTCGSCIDIYAPGAGYWMANAKDVDVYKKSSFGTSYAAAAVAGAAAVILGEMGDDVTINSHETMTARVKRILIETSQKDVIQGLSESCPGSNNRLLNVNNEAFGKPPQSGRSRTDQREVL